MPDTCRADRSLFLLKGSCSAHCSILLPFCARERVKTSSHNEEQSFSLTTEIKVYQSLLGSVHGYLMVTLLKSFIRTEHFWFQKIPNLKWWNNTYIFSNFLYKEHCSVIFLPLSTIFQGVQGCQMQEVFAGLCQSWSSREENVQTLSQSCVVLSGILKIEFWKLPYLWVRVSLKAFDTNTIFGLFLFDTSHIFYYTKYWIQLNMQKYLKIILEYNILQWNMSLLSCFALFITTQFTD